MAAAAATFQLTPKPMPMRSGIKVSGPRIHQTPPYARPIPTPLGVPLTNRPSTIAKPTPMITLFAMCTAKPAAAVGWPTILPIIGSMPIIPIIIAKDQTACEAAVGAPLQFSRAHFLSPRLVRFHGWTSSEIINRIPLLASEWAKGAFHYSGG